MSLNRFGNYTLDFARVPMSLPTKVRSALARLRGFAEENADFGPVA